ncbi:DUF4142 domain-containing protein [Actinoplanes sp. NPDC024001]|uniref:DUF4142 domain-containing protein n=1 Tax=Actinoplanes sp. NPDC024001 TaxID=3154598 RepID=UPI00340C00EE
MILRSTVSSVVAAGLLALPATAAQAAPSAQDAEFLRSAHQINLAEIAGGRIAWQKSSDEGVKELAATLMRNHIRLDAQVTQAARTLRVALPAVPTAAQQALTARYQAAPAGTFDDLFVATQQQAHRDALRLVEEQVAKGSDPVATKVAQAAAPIIAGHHRQLAAAD